LRGISFTEPALLPDNAGWIQTTPAPDDANLTVTHRFTDSTRSEWRASATLDNDPRHDNADTTTVLATTFDNRADWWQRYWRRVPRIDTPDSRWRFLYYYGLYKFAGLTAPQGIAATLQGPWVEEYQMPPWSCDYHFNINVQMCYWPAYQSGLHDHLLPLFALIESWLPVLRENAKKFVGIDDGYLLPHAVDDHCGIIGAFWTGTIDHACTAWVGKMMYDYWHYTGDEPFLRRLAYPFMAGALNVYAAMLERQPDGTLAMPVSVSPEYRAAAMDAWGRNASFQLAACHWLAGALENAAGVLGETPDPRWRDIRQNLPLASLHSSRTTPPDPDHAASRPEIAIWEGLLPEGSHRHHSHLAGFCPFDILDADDPEFRTIAERTADRWVNEGMGKWAGWSMPWAAMLHSRFGNPDMTDLTIAIWERVFTNEGHGTMHDPGFSGFSLIGRPGKSAPAARGEIMQMDAGMATTAAIMDAFIHTRRGAVHLFPGIPTRWPECSFERIRIEGGFLVSARRSGGRIVNLRIKATRAARLTLANPWPEPDTSSAPAGSPLVVDLVAGETREITPP
jgi:hypothetical protein